VPHDDDPRELGRRARKALATRQALFDAGLAAFRDRPLAVVSVLDLTEAADVAKGVFYLHFHSKDEYLLALWEHVTLGFLDALASRLAGLPARAPERIEAVAAHYRDTMEQAPRVSRFWLRMSSYFADELGRPGQSETLRRDYLERLAALVAGVPPAEVRPRDLRLAAVVDGCGWGLTSQAFHHARDALDGEAFVVAMRGAAGSVPPE
jgi:AcrR family transcriptional regulator